MAVTYGPADEAITITLAGLLADTSRESDAISNSAYHDILVFGQTRTAATPSGSQSGVIVYTYGSTGGSTYPDNITGSDANVILTVTGPVVRPLGTIAMPTGGVAHKAGPWSLRAVYGEMLPSKWGIVVTNVTGTTLSGTGAHHVFTYQGVTETVSG